MTDHPDVMQVISKSGLHQLLFLNWMNLFI